MTVNVQTLRLAGKTFVVLEVEEYQRLRAAATTANNGPPLPGPDAKGYYPAIEYATASLARKLIARRKKAGLSVEQLARKARVSAQMIRRLESGTSHPSVVAVDKLDRALKAAKV
jgi:DNA-binding XRE family transcriptional regulator